MRKKKQKRRGASGATNIVTPSTQPSPTTESEPDTESMRWVSLLQERLMDCPTDTLTRRALALMLEDLGQPEDALSHWNRVLLYDPSSLTAHAGVARCRQRIG